MFIFCKNNLKHKFSFIILSTLFTLCEAQISFPVERPIFKTGDTWTTVTTSQFTNQDTGSDTYVVSQISAEGYVVQRTRTDGRVTNFNLNLDSNSIQTIQDKREVLALLDWPLMQGKKWPISRNWADNERFGVEDGTCSVTGTEKVSIKAGEFDTVRIECNIFVNNRHNNATSNRKEIRYFSPVVKRTVKVEVTAHSGRRMTRNDTSELIAYRVQ
jgi:hypothetical protein